MIPFFMLISSNFRYDEIINGSFLLAVSEDIERPEEELRRRVLDHISFAEDSLGTLHALEVRKFYIKEHVFNSHNILYSGAAPRCCRSQLVSSGQLYWSRSVSMRFPESSSF